MPDSPRPFRLSLQAKVLVAVIGFLVILPVVTLWIVNDRMRQQMEDEALRTLTTAEEVFLKSLDNRASNFLSRYRSVAEEARFKVTAELKDKKTMDELLASLPEDALENPDVILYFTRDGDQLAGHPRTSSIDMEKFGRAAGAITRLALAKEPATGSIGFDGKAYSVVSVPVLESNNTLAGALTVGIRIGEMTVKELKLPGTEILLVVDGHVVASTVPGTERPETLLREVAATGQRSEAGRGVTFAGEHYMARSGEIAAPGPAQPSVRYVMLSSYEQRLLGLQETRRTLVELSLAGIIVSALVVSWFVRRLTRPLRELSDSAEAVGRGDFSRRIQRFSNDECGDLAESFNRMTSNLQSSRAELEQAMQTVRTTQNQLIQSEKLSAVGQFVAGVAHELNNPLTAVVGFSELLQSVQTDAKTRGFLDRIAKSAHRCHKIVHSLLSFARQHAPERKSVNLHTLVDEVLEIMAYDLRTSNVTIVREFAANLPPIMVDPHQLQQVFVNILGNARQAIEPFQRAGRIVIRTRSANDLVEIEFQDNGPGIRPEDLARIFDPFFTTKPVGKGTGLGLSLSYGIIQEHGGRIVARSEVGEGATFTITLPASRDGTEPAALRQGGTIQPFAAPAAPSGKTILVIDDEQWILDLAGELLRNEGHEVETAGGGQQALERLGRRKFDVIISDWKMPGLNGMRLYEHLQATDAAAAKRVLFMTGDVVSDLFQEFLKRNNLQCLSKPFAIGEFRAAVAKIMAT